MNEKLYHICNLSRVIIFRNEQDYHMAINRLATCAYATKSRIWAYSVMSTHFHIIVKTENIEEFCKLYNRSVTIWHNRKYMANIKMQITTRQLFNEKELLTAVNYVLKNPVHHNVVEFAFSYPYSSVNSYYPSLFNSENYVAQPSKTISEIGGRQYRQLFGKLSLPENIMILNNEVVLPESFLDTKSIRFLYYNLRGFVSNITKSLVEEIEMFKQDNSQLGLNRISLFGKKSDLELCKQIDAMIAPKTYTQLSTIEIEQVWDQVKKEGIDKFQFSRVFNI